MGYHVDRVNHSEIYSDNVKPTNMVESSFSRLASLRPAAASLSRALIRRSCLLSGASAATSTRSPAG